MKDSDSIYDWCDIGPQVGLSINLWCKRASVRGSRFGFPLFYLPSSDRAGTDRQTPFFFEIWIAGVVGPRLPTNSLSE